MCCTLLNTTCFIRTTSTCFKMAIEIPAVRTLPARILMVKRSNHCLISDHNGSQSVVGQAFRLDDRTSPEKLIYQAHLSRAVTGLSSYHHLGGAAAVAVLLCVTFFEGLRVAQVTVNINVDFARNELDLFSHSRRLTRS